MAARFLAGRAYFLPFLRCISYDEAVSIYELSLENFKGPLEKLLELIEEKKLEIKEISLAQVTEDFLKYLESIKEVPPAVLADFVVVASRLVLIKSKSLLPELPLTEEEESDIKELEERLLLYKTFKEAEKHLQKLWQGKKHSFARPYFLHMAGLPPVFYPAKNVTPDSMRHALEILYQGIERFTHAQVSIRTTIISLEKKMEEVLRRIASFAETSFGSLTESKSKAELVVVFLAILHLAREQLISLEQNSQFSDIIVRKKTANGAE